MKLAKRIDNIKFSPTVSLGDKARQLEKAGEKIIKLQTGESHLSTPECAKVAVTKALVANKTFYSHSKGIFELRSEICDYYNKKHNMKLDPEKNIIITPGAKQAILYAMLLLVEKGDEVIVPAPCWGTYQDIINLTEATPREVDSDVKKGFELSLDEIKKAITRKTRVIIINSPNNPTGRIIKAEDLKKLNELCKKNDIALISDEIYDKIVFDNNKFASILDFNKELDNCIYINGFSKTYAMSGWRLGFVLAKPEIIEAMTKLQQNSVTNPATFIQYGAVEAMKCAEEFTKQALAEYEEKRNFLMDEFKKLKKFKMVKPEGGIYAFIDITAVEKDSVKFCAELLDKCKVAAVPGVAFGKCSEGHIRVCFATSQQNLVDFVDRLMKNYE
ncbi:pyridoxal phosphate-dependent aminotransferase [Candidatus Woesearchaeota archaeon]|nr:pyridoxal phosphate-dependent aminotransferase [Candidatus Woesearchaeota archaeon]